MPRRPRLRAAGIPFHVIQRGNNRSACFFDPQDYQRYLACLRELGQRHAVAVHAYVLMTNHVHLLVTPREPEGVGLLMKFLGQIYVQYINRTYERTGSLWEGRFRSCLVDSERYVLTCHRYIECNPVRAGLVAHPADYRWSSYRANALGALDPLVTMHPCVLNLGRTATERHGAYRELFEEQVEAGFVEEIRNTTNSGLALGSGRFKADLAATLGRQVEPRKRGPGRKRE